MAHSRGSIAGGEPAREEKDDDDDDDDDDDEIAAEIRELKERLRLAEEMRSRLRRAEGEVALRREENSGLRRELARARAEAKNHHLHRAAAAGSGSGSGGGAPAAAREMSLFDAAESERGSGSVAVGRQK